MCFMDSIHSRIQNFNLRVTHIWAPPDMHTKSAITVGIAIEMDSNQCKDNAFMVFKYFFMLLRSFCLSTLNPKA